MDQRQQYDTYSHGYVGHGMRETKGSNLVHEYRPYYPPERREAYENEPIMSSLAHTHRGPYTGRRSFGREVSSFEPDSGISLLHNSYVATDPGVSGKEYAYSEDYLPNAIDNGYGIAGWTYQERSPGRSQGFGVSDIMQVESETIPPPGQRYPHLVSPYGSTTVWRPGSSPIGQAYAFSSDAPSFPYPESSTTCVNRRNHPLIDLVSVYHPDQREVNSITEGTYQGAKNYVLRPIGDIVPSNRQLPAQDTRCITPHDDCPDVPYLEQTRSRLSVRRSAATNTPDNPVAAHADEDGVSNGQPKQRKKKPRITKPRKPRTLTDEGKAHAKACTHKLPEDMPTDLHDKRTPKTPWTEPLTPDYGPGDNDPVFYRSSQENDLDYEHID